MKNIEFGIAVPTLSNLAGLAHTAEALGFDYVCSGEHVMFHVPAPNSLISLSIAAGATTKIKLLSSVVLLPLYQPVVLAKMTSVLDFASKGRFHMGVGVGGEFPKEFEACGIPVKQRGSRSNEALEIIKRLWTEENVSVDGRYTKFSSVTLKPRPIQQPHPPIWVAGRKEPAMLRAAKYGNGWLPYMYTPEMLRDSFEKIRRMRDDLGISSEFKIGLSIFTSLHRDRELALRQAATVLGGNYAQDFSKLVGHYALAGTAADCRKRLGEYVEAGVRSFFLAPMTAGQDPENDLKTIAEEIVPEFR